MPDFCRSVVNFDLGLLHPLQMFFYHRHYHSNIVLHLRHMFYDIFIWAPSPKFPWLYQVSPMSDSYRQTPKERSDPYGTDLIKNISYGNMLT